MESQILPIGVGRYRLTGNIPAGASNAFGRRENEIKTRLVFAYRSEYNLFVYKGIHTYVYIHSENVISFSGEKLFNRCTNTERGRRWIEMAEIFWQK